MEDKQTGIAIRFIRQFDVTRAASYREDSFCSIHDAAIFLASRDTRDVPMVAKLYDAYSYIASMPES